MCNTVIVAALEREVSPFIKNWTRLRREHAGRTFTVFEHDKQVLICGGIGAEAARRATEAAIALYRPSLIKSVGFAGALDASLRVGDIFPPSLILDARDGSRIQLEGGEGTLITFMEVAGVAQKVKLSQAYGARAVDMEAAVVASTAAAHGIAFAATKVISDEHDFEIPGMSSFITTEGQFRTLSFVLFAAVRPWLWSGVVILARNSARAARALATNLQSICELSPAVGTSLSSKEAVQKAKSINKDHLRGTEARK